MRLLPDFSPKKNETALSFGVSWSLVGSAIALTYLASCSYVIPENPRPPRYNTVMGEKRVPPKNPSPANNFTMPETQQQQRSAPAAQSYGQPQQPYAQPQSQLTPVAPRAAEQPFVQNTGVTSTQTAAPAYVPPPKDYSWWNPRGWFGDAQPAQPTNTPLRQAPAMNTQTSADSVSSYAQTHQIQSYDMPAPVMQPLPSTDGYPSLQSTPQSPLVTGQAQARDKLNYARSDMEAELDAASGRANQLRRDAQSETTILSSMPQAAPAPAPAPTPMPSVTRPPEVVSNEVSTPKVVAPASRGMPPSEEISVSEPIALKAPTGKGEPIDTPGISTSMSTMDPSTSTFDPMAGSTQPITLKPPEGTYQGKRYLPESRYVTQR